jgi:nucleoside-diphosphate-sugar epimerase
MTNQLHTVLGGTGTMGNAIIRELTNRNLPVRAVQRHPHTENVETIQADLLNPEETKNAVKGSSHVYLCAALPYNADLWLKSWPALMQNVISACEATKANLVFFDNIYMYGPPPLSVPFDENSQQLPVARKGIARKQTADLLMKAISEQKVNALIGRSADFYGPGATNSPLYVSFLERMLNGKNPMSIARGGTKHTFANTTDNAKALVDLAVNPDTYGQVWHLPVGEPLTVEEITEIFNKELGTNFKTNFLPPLMRKLLSLFIPIIKEASEMLYQSDNEYIMSFEKFRARFPDFQVTPFEKGVREMINSFKETSR